MDLAAFDKQFSNSSFDAKAAWRGRVNASCSLANPLVRGFIIERADFQGLPRASYSFVSKTTTLQALLLPERVKHLDHIKLPLYVSHTRAKLRRAYATIFFFARTAKLKAQLTLNDPKTRSCWFFIVLLGKLVIA